MRVKLAMTLAAVVICSVGVGFGQQNQPIDMQQADVAAEYASIRTLDKPELREVYQAMPPKSRQELWTMHLVTFLREHRELDAEQRGVILEGIGLVASGIFDVQPSDPRWRELAGNEIERVVAKAKALMPQELVWSAFYSLSDTPETGASSNPSRFKRQQSTAPYCDCSTYMGCEDSNATCVPRQGPGFCYMVPSYNCGPYYVYACDGLCQYL